jgi:5-methyltetrahydropteroyltriglutamate--homocysteine methyltransferase
MTSKQPPPFRAEHVGSLLRPNELKTAFRDAAQGRIDAKQFAEIQDRCIRDAIAMQESVGLSSITDGEFRRGSWFYGFVQAVDGLTTRDSIFDFHDATGGRASFQAPYVESKIKRTRGITTDEFAFVRAATSRTPKVTMPTPSCIHFFRGNESVSRTAYRHLEDFWNDLFAVYREEIAALAVLGCRYVQLDEVAIAMLCDPKIQARVAAAGLEPARLLETYISAINLSVAARPPGMTIGLHLCKGNYKGHWMAEGSYDAVAEQLFGETDVDAFFLEYESERAGGFAPLRHVPNDKTVILGLISSKRPELEPFDLLRRRVDEASRHIALDRLGVSPQCGFASSVGGNPLSLDDERRKLARVVELADAVWG